MWVVMTSTAKMPSSWQWRAEFRNVALVHLSQEYTAKGSLPAMISERAKGVSHLSTMPGAVIHLGLHRVGKSPKSAYAIALVEAERRCQQLSNLAPVAQAAEIVTWGGSA